MAGPHTQLTHNNDLLHCSMSIKHEHELL